MCPDLGVWPELSEATVTLSILPPKSVCDTDKRLSVALQVIYSVCVHTLGWGGVGIAEAVHRCRVSRKKDFVRKYITAVQTQKTSRQMNTRVREIDVHRYSS